MSPDYILHAANLIRKNYTWEIFSLKTLFQSERRKQYSNRRVIVSWILFEENCNSFRSFQAIYSIKHLRFGTWAKDQTNNKISCCVCYIIKGEYIFHIKQS